MAGFGDNTEKNILEALFKQTAFSNPATLYISLHSADPTDSTATAISNEISGNGYARTSVSADTNNTTHTYWTAITAGSVSNAANIDMGTASGGSWNGGAAIQYFAIFDASTSGNLIASGQINSGTGVVVLDGTNLVFPANNLTLTLD